MCRPSFSNTWWLPSWACINSLNYITSLALETHDFLLLCLTFTIPKNPLVICQGEECYMLFKFESFYKHSSFREVLSHSELNIITILLCIEKSRKRRVEWPIWAKKFFTSSLAQLPDSEWHYSLWDMSLKILWSSLNLSWTWSLLYLNRICYIISSFMEYSS